MSETIVEKAEKRGGDAGKMSPSPGEAGSGAQAMSQWALIRLRFSKHRLAVWSGYVIVLLYVLALVAEFVAPCSKSRRNVDYAYAPPQVPRFSLGEGFYVPLQEQRTDTETLARYYVTSEEVRVPLGFWVEGESYRFWGPAMDGCFSGTLCPDLPATSSWP